MSYFILPPFSKNTPGKIGRGIEVSEKNTLIMNDNVWRFAIAAEPIDAKVDGKKLFCVRVDNAVDSYIMIGFTPKETFVSDEMAFFGNDGFTGAGMNLYDGSLFYPDDKCHNVIDREISRKAKEIIVILTVNNNGKKKEIQFLCDGKESKSSDVSEHLKRDRLFPAFILGNITQQVTTIPIDQIKTRTPEIENLIKEYRQQQKEREAKAERERYTLNVLRQVLELRRVFLQQVEIQRRAVMAKMKFEMKM
jgi:hypothetical protein